MTKQLTTYSADEPVSGVHTGVIEDLLREIKDDGKPFTWGIRDDETGMFFLMEEDCKEMQDGYRATFTLNANAKISHKDWDYIFKKGQHIALSKDQPLPK